MWHRFLRQRLIPYLVDFAPEATCALGGKGIEIGAHLPRAARDWAVSRGLCCAVLFWDIEAAYYSVVRELAFGADLSDERVAALLGKLCLPVEAFQELLAQAREGSALAEAGVPGHPAAMTEEALKGSRFVTHGCDRVARLAVLVFVILG